MVIKIIGLDLDGTTLNNQGKLTEDTMLAFKKASDKGVHIVIATGRTFASLPKEVLALPYIEYVITSNGAHITNIRTGEEMYSNYIAEATTEQIVDLIKDWDCSLEAFTGGRAYIGQEELDLIMSHKMAYRDTAYIINTRTPVPDIKQFILEHKGKIENININFEDVNDKYKVEGKLKNIEGVTLTSSFIHNWELGGKDTSKGNALRILCKELNLDPKKKLMACGDSPNDIAMLDLARVGVAVGNATEDVINNADYVAPSNDDNGVAEAIYKYVL